MCMFYVFVCLTLFLVVVLMFVLMLFFFLIFFCGVYCHMFHFVKYPIGIFWVFCFYLF